MPPRSTPLAVSRRTFLGAAAAFAAAPRSPAETRPPIVAFNTANLVARVSGYRYQLSDWMDQHRKTVAATDEAAWRAICREVVSAGFTAIEVWEAHAAPESLDAGKTKLWRRLLAEHNLLAVAYAGGLRKETLRIAADLGIPHVDGGLRDHTPAEATALCRDHGVRFNIENHPEKSAAELLGRIGGGNEWLGVCVDTGWLGTQGVDGPAVIAGCAPFVRHTHVKDVKAAGRHETCLLGEGSARVADCVAAMLKTGYAGAWSWEDEPEGRNPLDSAVRNREWIEKRLAA